MGRRAVCQVATVVAALGLLLGGKAADAREHLFEAMGMSKVPPKAAPDFTLPTADGQQVSLQQYRGKVVFLNFWATWCIPCREEMPALERLHQTYQAQDLAVISIDLKETAEQVKGFFEKHSLSFPALLDQNGSVFRDYLVAGMPTTYLIGRDGMLLARGVGGRDWTRAEAQQLIKELIKPTPVAAQPGPQVSP
ncbi:MAG TPA: TlpA disulfide reductase family protein [Candidatus Tectomicrobia bacterium]|nr:TlpA disulfide reductase family protein [Candidatus Tectomicrobia bacterium]